MPTREGMEIIFLLVGLPLFAVGAAIVLSELRSRRGKQPVGARIVGFSTGQANQPNIPRFHSVAQYLGTDGRNYYVESNVGSSAPLHAVGDSVTVLVNPTRSDQALLQSALSYVLGIAIAIM